MKEGLSHKGGADIHNSPPLDWGFVFFSKSRFLGCGCNKTIENSEASGIANTGSSSSSVILRLDLKCR